jgi:putative flippase GtrA
VPTAVSLHGYRALGLQYGRFAVVGLVATLVHVFVYAASIEWLGQTPLAGNALGFAAGVNVSFLGHRRWTFADARTIQAGRSLARFWIVALAGFVLNSLFVHLVTGTAGLGYGWAIPLIAGVTPVLTFVLAKRWAFRG